MLTAFKRIKFFSFFFLGLLFTPLIIFIVTGQTELHPFLRNGHTDQVNALVFSPNNNLFASASDDQTVKIWEVSTGHNILTLFQSVKEPVDTVVFSPDGKTVAGGGSGGVTLWELATGREIAHFADDYFVNFLVFSPDGKHLALGTADSISIWDLETKKQIQTFTEAKAPLAINSAWTQVATLDSTGAVTVRDLKSGGKLRPFESVKGQITSLSFSPAGDSLISLMTGANSLYPDELSLVYWNVLTGKQLKPFKPSVSEFCLFTPDGKNLLTASPDPIKNGALTLLSPVTGKAVSFFGREKDVLAGDIAALSPNGKFLALTNINHRNDIHLFDFESKTLMYSLKGFTDDVTSLAFISDSQHLVAGYKDETGAIPICPPSFRSL